MKKTLKFGALAVGLVCLVLTLASCAKTETDPESGLILSLDKNTETYTVVGCAETVTEVEIPDKYNGIRITAIGDGAFSGNQRLTTVTIPSTVELIGGVAFNGCSELNTVNFEGFDTGSALTELPASVFNKCSKLEHIEIPDSVRVIGYRAFSDCSMLEELSLPHELTAIMNYAFAGCTKLETVEMNTSGGFKVYANAFAGCPSLTSLATPETYTDADREQVYEYDPATKLLTGAGGTKLIKYLDPDGESEYTIPLTILEIEDGAFMSQKGLTAIHAAEGHSVFGDENGVLYRGDTLFAYPVGRTDTDYTVPAHTKAIGEFAFAGNGHIQRIDLARSSVTDIGISAFKNCRRLTTLTFAPAVSISVGVEAFVGCDDLTVYRIPDEKSEYLIVNRVLRSSDGTKIVSYPANSTITSFEIPAEITEIVPGAFAYNSSIEEFTVSPDNTAFAPEEGVLYAIDGAGKKTALVAYPVRKTDAEYIAPESLTAVYAYAFARNVSIRSVTLPSGVVKLDKSLFVDCASLTELTVLTRVELSIEANALAGCASLKTVNFGGNAATWDVITSNAKLGSGNTILKAPDRVTVNCEYKKP